MLGSMKEPSCRHLVPVKTDVDNSHRMKLCLGLHIGVSCGGSDITNTKKK